jgi:hydroxymethylbilane synthase
VNRQENRPLRIGTRGSPLALAQANEVRNRLAIAHPGLAERGLEVVVIHTSGDRIQDRPLADAGGKGLFTKEIEEALIAASVDLAVHSMKDVPTALPDGLMITCLLPREDPRDAFLAPRHPTLADLPRGATVGTSSLRRRALLLNARPDLRIVEFRGNVDTRLRKLERGEADATLLALAGLRRLGLAHRGLAVLSPDEMLPAIAQGAVGIECRANDRATRGLLAALHDEATAHRVDTERAFLAALDGSCRTPIAGLAEIVGDSIEFRGAIVTPDGVRLLSVGRRGVLADGARMGADAGAELRRKGGPDFFKSA